MEGSRGDVEISHAVLHEARTEIQGVRHENAAENGAGLEEAGAGYFVLRRGNRGMRASECE